MNNISPKSTIFTPHNNAHLKVGERVICTSSVTFINGEKHYKGKIYTVEPDTAAYFSLFTGTSDYCNYLRIEDVR